MPKKIKFADKIGVIDQQIGKHRGRWRLKAIAWMDFDDVAQILRLHIHEKWKLWDQKRPLEPWLNRLITNQINNLIRNTYTTCAKPCIKCPAYQGANLCSLFSVQSSECGIYAKWERTKKAAHDVKLPVTIEHHLPEVRSQPEDGIDLLAAVNVLHTKMQKNLKPIEWQVYRMLYIQCRSEEYVAKKMGYTTNEAGRKRGYKRIRQLQKIVIDKAKKILANDGCETTI